MEWSSIFNSIFSVTYNILYFGVIIGMIIIIILDNRNPVKTMAWVLVLAFLPYVGIVFYFFFGRSTRREKIISKKSFNRLMKKPMAEFVAQESYDLPADQYQVAQLFRNTNQALPFDGNQLGVYTDGYSMIQSLVKELMQAKSHIHMEFYIFEDDPIGRLMRDVLIDKARQGVEVRLIYDDVGCWHVPNRFFEEMIEAGIDARAFLKVRFPLFTSKVNYRNHRKIVVIDGKVGFVGGMNIALRYIRGFDWGIWRDTHLMVEGKAVHGLQTAFLLDWYFVNQTLLTSNKFFPVIESAGNSMVQVVTSDPIAEWKEIMQGLCLAISSAKKYFYIQTPYFLPTEPILASLQTAALAGVDIRLMIPQKADAVITHLATCSYLKDVMKAGVKVFLYQKGFLHSKLMVSDDALSTVGSTNMDFRSFEHNFEVNAFMYDEPTAIRLKEIFFQDQRDCIPLYLKNWEKRSKKQKVKESVVRILSPML